MVGITDTDSSDSKLKSYESEYSLMMDKMNCGKKEMDKMLETTYKLYPHIGDKKQAIYLLAREKRLQFIYDNSNGKTSLEELDDELDVDLSYFLD